MIEAYLEGKREASTIGMLVTGLIFAFFVLGSIIAFGSFFGWIPLGERANILRSNRNSYEIIVTVLSVIYALCSLRTAFGLYSRERASLRWSQWMLFITVTIGSAILLSVIIPVGFKVFPLARAKY